MMVRRQEAGTCIGGFLESQRGTYEVSTPKHVEYLMACISAQLDGELFSEKLANESLFNY